MRGNRRVRGRALSGFQTHTAHRFGIRAAIGAALGLFLVISGCPATDPPSTSDPDSDSTIADSVQRDAVLEVADTESELGPDASTDTNDAGPDDADIGTDTADTDSTDTTLPCLNASTGTDAGLVQLPALNEASGIVASLTHTDIYWTHNDSGDTPTLFAIDGQGGHRGTFLVTGAEAKDWEDIARAPGSIEIEGATSSVGNKLVIGDFGDNLSVRPSLTLYVVDEPAPGPAGAPVTNPTAAAISVPFTYPDGPRDAEGLAVDPIDGVVYVLDKAWDTGISTLYRYPPPLRPNEVVVLESVGSIPLDDLGGGLSFLATGMDVSPDGAWLTVRTYEQVLAWHRPPGAPLWTALQQPRCQWEQQVEPQGEAVAFSADGFSYVTLSENQGQPLWRFALTTP